MHGTRPGLLTGQRISLTSQTQREDNTKLPLTGLLLDLESGFLKLKSRHRMKEERLSSSEPTS